MSGLILTKTLTLPPVCLKDVLRYAGCKEVTDEIFSLLQSCLEEAEGKLFYKVCYREFPLTIQGDVCDFGDFSFVSERLASHLRGCGRAVVFAATLGVEIDRLIVKYSKISPAKAFMFQAIGAERIEALCDVFCDEILSQQQEKHGKEIRRRSRFSPGYGDLPLATQKTIFAVLECQRKIGLTLTDGLLMSPSKSVTAVVGIE